MNCPVCNVTLVISSREGIEIDHCPQCRGVWLDRGELDKIIERAAPAVVGQAPPPRFEEPPRYEEPRRHDDRPRYEEPRRYDDRQYRKKRRSSFLEELFDFD